MKRQDGFTLIELIIAFALLSAGVMSVIMTYSYIVQLQEKQSAIRGVQQSSRYIMDQIGNDVRGTAIITLNSPTSISLQSSIDTGAKVVTYAMSGSQLYRCTGGGACTSANGMAVGSNGTRVRAVKFKLEPAALTGAVKQSLEIDMTVAQSDPTLDGTINPFAYSYDVTSVFTPRGL